jgi:hypothetical protein
VAGGDVQGVGACPGRHDRNLAAFREHEAAGEIVLDRKPEDDRDADSVPDGRNHLQAEARTIFQCSAIGVGAQVFRGVEELRDQVAVGAVNLDAVEAGLLGAPRRRREAGDREFDVGERHLLGNDGLAGDLEYRVPDGGRRHRRLLADVGPGVAAGMADLDRRSRAAAVDGSCKPFQAGQETVVMDARLAAAVTAGAGRRRHFDGDETGAAARARHVVVDDALGDEAALVGEPRRHRRHDDAVPDLHRADAARRQEDIRPAHIWPAHGRSSPPPISATFPVSPSSMRIAPP